MLPFQAHADGRAAGASRRQGSLTMRKERAGGEGFCAEDQPKGCHPRCGAARTSLRGGAVDPLRPEIRAQLSRISLRSRLALQSQIKNVDRSKNVGREMATTALPGLAGFRRMTHPCEARRGRSAFQVPGFGTLERWNDTTESVPLSRLP